MLATHVGGKVKKTKTNVGGGKMTKNKSSVEERK
jgi:hypothetical protein